MERYAIVNCSKNIVGEKHTTTAKLEVKTNKGGKQWLRKVPFLVLCLLIHSNASAQLQFNLVENYSFEDYIICPTANNGLPPPPPWYSAGKSKTVAYLNSCNPDIGYRVPTNATGYQYAKTGDGYIGFYFTNGLNQNNRNYLQTKLKDSLQESFFYLVNFYINLGNNQKYACNNIGLLLTKTAVYVDTIVHPYGVLPANPQILNYGNPIITDTFNWVKVSGIYKASGGEQFITIGNFKTDAQTSYKQVQPTGYNGAGYLIDDVSVIPLDSFCLQADAGNNITITQGDSAFIGSYTNGIDSLKWFANGTTLIDSIKPGFYVQPSATTFYVLQQTVNGCFSSDTVWVNVNPLPLKFTMYDVRFTNENQSTSLRGTKQSVENIWQTANEINVSHFNIQRSSNGKDFATIGTIKANNKTLNNYIFTDNLQGFQIPPLEGGEALYYRIESIDFDGKKQYTETKRVKLNEQQETRNVVLYPNPAKDIVNIECKDGIKEIKLFNAMGKQIATGTNLRNDGNLKLQTLNLQQVSKGLYLVKVVSKTGAVYNNKLVIE